MRHLLRTRSSFSRPSTPGDFSLSLKIHIQKSSFVSDSNSSHSHSNLARLNGVICHLFAAVFPSIYLHKLLTRSPCNTNIWLHVWRYLKITSIYTAFMLRGIQKGVKLLSNSFQRDILNKAQRTPFVVILTQPSVLVWITPLVYIDTRQVDSSVRLASQRGCSGC